MATEFQMEAARAGGGTPARHHFSKHINLTMVGGVQVADTSFVPPTDSRIAGFRVKNATAFTGTPTNLYLTIGKTSAADASYVANTDVKAAGDFSPSLATGAIADLMSWPSGQALAATLTANGGTTPGGTVTVEVFYSPPSSVA